MLLGVRFAADTAILLIALVLQVVPANRLFTGVDSRRSVYSLILILSSILLGLGLAGNLAAIYGISGPALFWARGLALAWALAVICSSLIATGVRRIASATPTDPGRRGFLQLAAKGAVAAPLAGVGFGMFIERDHFEVKEVSVPIAGLPKDLDGIRIAQLTDVHLGPFLSEKRFARAIDMANELRPHLAIATGDLISYRGDPLDDAIRQILRLKADAAAITNTTPGRLSMPHRSLRATEHESYEWRIIVSSSAPHFLTLAVLTISPWAPYICKERRSLFNPEMSTFCCLTIPMFFRSRRRRVSPLRCPDILMAAK
jgi:hypothetical protein